MSKSKKLAVIGFSGLSGATQVGMNYLKGIEIPHDQIVFIFHGKTDEINPGYLIELNKQGIEACFAKKTSGLIDPKSEYRVFKHLQKYKPENIFMVSNAPFLSVLTYKMLNPKVNIISIEQHPLNITSLKEYIHAYVGLTFYNHVVPASDPYAEGYRAKMKPFSKIFSRKITVIPNGVEIPFSNVSFFSENEPRNTFVIGMAARFDDVKDFDTVVRALHEVKQKNSTHFTLKLAGDGPNRPRTEQLVKELRLSEQVQFLGLINKVQMEEFYRSLDLYIQSTKGEVMSFSMIESMGHGKTFLATRVRGVQEFIQEGENGMLFEFGNASDLAEKIHYLQQNPAVLAALSRGARAHYDQYFSLPAMVKSYSKLMSWEKYPAESKRITV